MDGNCNEWTIHEDAREVREICRMLCERVVELEAERDQARAWAAAWKAAAKYWRAEDDATEEMRQAAVAEMERLREALDGLLRCSAYREFGHCGQCEQRARAALKGSADE